LANDIERQQQHFENIALKYLESRKHKNHLRYKSLLWDFFFQRHADLKNRASLRVLEPMCGYAEGKKLLETHLGSTISYTGFDYSPSLVAEVLKADPSLDVSVMDVTQFKPPREPYDVIILIGGLHHVFRKADEVVANLSTALAPGGYFINFEPTHDNWILRKVREYVYRKNAFFDDDTEQGFELDDLHGMFRKHLTLVDEIYPGLLAYILYYNPDAFPKLNMGSERMVNFLFSAEKWFYRNWIGRKCSFATLSLWQKPRA
jgi:SAM-dependent methyltransferase